MSRKCWVVRFARGTTVMDRLVQILGRTYYSHVDFVLQEGDCFGSQFPDGVQFYVSKDESHYFILKEGIPEEWLEAEYGKPYDPWGVLCNWLTERRPGWDDTKSWYCSELVLYMLEKQSEKIFKAGTLTPDNLLTWLECNF